MTVNYMAPSPINNDEGMIGDIYVLWDDETSLPNYVIDPGNNQGPVVGNFSRATLHVPVGKTAMYKAQEVWGVFGRYSEDATGIVDITDEFEGVEYTFLGTDIHFNTLPGEKLLLFIMFRWS